LASASLSAFSAASFFALASASFLAFSSASLFAFSSASLLDFSSASFFLFAIASLLASSSASRFALTSASLFACSSAFSSASFSALASASSLALASASLCALASASLSALSLACFAALASASLLAFSSPPPPTEGRAFVAAPCDCLLLYSATAGGHPIFSFSQHHCIAFFLPGLMLPVTLSRPLQVYFPSSASHGNAFSPVLVPVSVLVLAPCGHSKWWPQQF